MTDFRPFYTFNGEYTFDLHELAAVVLRERQLNDVRFNKTRLREICEGNAVAACLPPHAQTIWASIPVPNKVGYFLEEEQPVYDAGHDVPKPVELSEFFHPELKLPDGRSTPLSEVEKETLFWRIRHHDSGYILCETVQQVLDALPEGRTKLRIRTSQGHEISNLSPKAFHIAEVALNPKQCNYISSFKPLHVTYPDFVLLQQHLMGHDAQPVPWVYVLFGDAKVANTDPKKDGRVMLDLISPLMGMRGLGGEVFSMERLKDYHDRILPTGGDEVINYNDQRSVDHEGYILSGRIQNVSKPEARAIVEHLVKRVLGRLSRIAKGEEVYCAYCGKKAAGERCSKCKSATYCGPSCQRRAWKYHKKWCEVDVLATRSI